MMLKPQKHLFDIPENITYFNIASQAPLFKSSYEADLQGLMQKSKFYTITDIDYFESVNELKQLFATLTDCRNYQRVVTVPSASYGIATVANMTLNKNDEILVINAQLLFLESVSKCLLIQMNGHIILLSHSNIQLFDHTRQQLTQENIFVTYFKDQIRLSCHIYNTKDDFEKLVNTIKTII